MKHRLLFVAFAIAVIFIPGCKSTESTENPPVDSEHHTSIVSPASDEAPADEPLLLDDEPLLLEDEPLLLEDEPLLLDGEPLLLADESPEDESAAPGADNSRCHVCHINYVSEDIAVVHAKADMGCAHCHGESDEHIADESWASGGNGTAPEVMFTRPEINPFCMGCHPEEELAMPQHEPVFLTGDKQKVCTDCHGEHRLAVRKCKWK